MVRNEFWKTGSKRLNKIKKEIAALRWTPPDNRGVRGERVYEREEFKTVEKFRRAKNSSWRNFRWIGEEALLSQLRH